MIVHKVRLLHEPPPVMHAPPQLVRQCLLATSSLCGQSVTLAMSQRVFCLCRCHCFPDTHLTVKNELVTRFSIFLYCIWCRLQLATRKKWASKSIFLLFYISPREKSMVRYTVFFKYSQLELPNILWMRLVFKSFPWGSVWIGLFKEWPKV